MMNHTEEFKMRCDLSDIEKQLFTLCYRALEHTISEPGEVLAKINAVRAQLDELAKNASAQIADATYNAIFGSAGAPRPKRARRSVAITRAQPPETQGPLMLQLTWMLIAPVAALLWIAWKLEH
jgi:hypothetical protein